MGRIRTTTLLLALALVAAACGGGSGDGGGGSGGGGGGNAAGELPPCPVEALEQATGPVEVVLWHGYGVKIEETLIELVAAYNDSQDKVRVRVENQGTYLELWRKYQAGIAGNRLPAIAIPDDTVTQQIIDSGTVLPAQSCIEETGYDVEQLLETSRSYYTIDDVLYPASLNTSAALLYYNRNHFTRAGLDPDTAPETLDEMREHAQAIKDAGVVDKPIVLNLSPSIVEMLLTGAGIAVVDNDNGRGGDQTTASTFDDPRTVELLQWVRDMVDDGLLEVVPGIDGQVAHYLAMANQSASMTIETSTAATSVEAFLGGDLDVDDVSGAPDGAEDVDLSALDIGAAMVPGIEEKGQIQMGGGAWYIMSTTAPEVQAAAWDFLTWFNQPENQATWSIRGSYLPYNTGALDDPRLQEAWESSLSGRWLALAFEELRTGLDPDFPGPLIGPYDEFRDAVRKGLDDLLVRDQPAEQVAAEVAETTTEAIQRYNDESF